MEGKVTETKERLKNPKTMRKERKERLERRTQNDNDVTMEHPSVKEIKVEERSQDSSKEGKYV